MEKIKFRPLIGHLQHAADAYNQVYRDHEMRFGEIPGPVLTSWIVGVIEPVIAASARTEDEAGKIFQPFYKGLLEMFGNQLAVTYGHEYESAWLMLKNNPGLVQTSFPRAFNAINNALLSIRKYRAEWVEDWIAYMTATIGSCRTIEEFFSAGRIYAWICGLSHHRKRAISELASLSPELKTVIAEQSGTDLSSLSKHWPSVNPAFTGTAGGFAGLNGSFVEPPRVALIDNQVVATDGHTSHALFADNFGAVLISGNTFDPLAVRALSNNDGIRMFTSKFGEKLVLFEDITSSVMVDHTLVLSRNSSFYLYIFGWYV